MAIYLYGGHVFSDRSSVFVTNNDTDLTDYAGLCFPKKLLISLSGKCNLRCKHCYRGYAQVGAGIVMKKDMIDQVIRDFFTNISAIRLGGNDLGEQMTSPYFDYFLNKAREHSIDIDMITNNTLMDKNKAELIAQTVSSISLSLEGMSRNYEKIRSFKWSQFEKAVDLLVEARQRNVRDKKLMIALAITVMRNFKEDYFKLVQFAKQKQLDFIPVRNFRPFSRKECQLSFLYFPKEYDDYFTRLQRFAKEMGVTMIEPPPMPSKKIMNLVFPRKLCSFPFETIGIQADGRIHPCCESSFDLGYYTGGYRNVIERWTSDGYVNLRKTVNSASPCYVCRQCEQVNYNPLANRPEFLSLAQRLIKKVKNVIRPTKSFELRRNSS